jgi:hypothetical protein
MIKSRRMRLIWVGHVAQMCENRRESQMGRDHYENQEINGQIIFNWILEC